MQRHKPALGSRQPAACSITRLNISVIVQKYENRRKLLQLIWVIQAIFTARCHSTNVSSANQENPLEIRVINSKYVVFSTVARELAPPSPHSAAPSSCRLAITCATLHTRQPVAAATRLQAAGCTRGSHNRSSGQPTNDTAPPYRLMMMTGTVVVHGQNGENFVKKSRY